MIMFVISVKDVIMLKKKIIKMKNVKLMNRFVKFVTFKSVNAITLAPFGIYVRKEKDLTNKILINHEQIHYKQQKEMLYILFYIIYLLEWFIRMLILKDSHDAYLNISFEREAYNNEHNPNYLKKRKPYSWFCYIFKNK